MDLGNFVRRLLMVRRAEFDGKGIAVRAAVAVRHPVSHLLAQAVSNLLDDAAKYTPPGGEVTVEVTPDGREARVAVTNSGEGITPEDYRSSLSGSTVERNRDPGNPVAPGSAWRS